jgi:hypothetical protein
MLPRVLSHTNNRWGSIMAMSRKDYRAFAAVLKESLEASETQGEKYIVARTAKELAVTMKSDNSNFRYDTFFEACGLDGWGEVVKS